MLFNEVTRGYFRAIAEDLPAAQARAMQRLLKNPQDKRAAAQFRDNSAVNSRLRTTCVATQLQGRSMRKTRCPSARRQR